MSCMLGVEEDREDVSILEISGLGVSRFQSKETGLMCFGLQVDVVVVNMNTRTPIAAFTGFTCPRGTTVSMSPALTFLIPELHYMPES